MTDQKKCKQSQHKHKFNYDKEYDWYMCACGAWYSDHCNSAWLDADNEFPDPYKECTLNWQ